MSPEKTQNPQSEEEPNQVAQQGDFAGGERTSDVDETGTQLTVGRAAQAALAGWEGAR